MKLGSDHEINNLLAAKLLEAMKRALGELEYENINIYSEYEIDFWRERVEVEVVLKDMSRIRHIETVMVPDLHIDQMGSVLCMIAEFEYKFTQDSRRILMETPPLALNHIRFLSDDKPVCHWPARLGTDFVYNTALKKNEEVPCKECSQLLLAHNTREQMKDDQRKLMPQYVEYHPDRISPVKVMMLIAFIAMMTAVVLGLILIVR